MRTVRVIPTQDHESTTHFLRKGVETTLALHYAKKLERSGIVAIKEERVSTTLEQRMTEAETDLSKLKRGKTTKATASAAARK